MNATEYNGNASAWDFILQQGNIQNTTNNELVMTLSQENNGTLLTSTRYVHYGTITARRKLHFATPAIYCTKSRLQ